MLSMAEFGKGMLQSNKFNLGLYEQDGSFANKSCWVIMQSDDNDHDHHDETSSSSLENSISSYESMPSSSSSELIDDASSSSSSSSSSHSNGPLYELSELMAQLPIQRGLSRYFQGKSQSFTSLSKVMSIEDLAKKENPFNTRRRMKACKSYASNLDAYKSYTLPKPTISKKASSRSSFSTRRSGGFLGTINNNNNNNNNLPPLPTIQKNF